MINIVVSGNCPHCDRQLEIMQKSFFADEYSVVKVGSQEFEGLTKKHFIDAVPFIIVDDVGYAAPGLHDGTELRKIERGVPPDPRVARSGVFNLHRAKAALA